MDSAASLCETSVFGGKRSDRDGLEAKHGNVRWTVEMIKINGAHASRRWRHAATTRSLSNVVKGSGDFLDEVVRVRDEGVLRGGVQDGSAEHTR